MILETKRLILRPPRKSDWKDIVEGANDLEVAKNLVELPYPYRKKHALSWISKTQRKLRKKSNSDYTFAIELKSEGKVIGATNLDVNKPYNKAKTGTWINKKYWRKGYILEAKVPILDFAFKKLKLRKVESLAFADNKASNAMSIKLGFTLEGRKRKTIICKATGKIHDDHIYGMLKEEWKKSRPRIVKAVEQKVKKDSETFKNL